MNEQYAQLLMSWHHEALVRQAAHYKAADRSRRRHLYIGIPGIVIPTLVGASLLAASQSGFFPGLVFALATLCVVSAMASAMQTFLRFDTRASYHQASAQQYGALRRQIERDLHDLSIDNGQSQLDQTLVDLVGQFDSLGRDAPSIPLPIWNRTKDAIGVRESQEHLTSLTAPASLIHTLREYGPVSVGYLSRILNLSQVETLEVIETLRAQNVVKLDGSTVLLREAEQA